MALYTEYIEFESSPNSNNFLKISIMFNKDTRNWATGETKEKGYQVVVTPVQKGEKFVITGAFSGFYEIIYPIGRQSNKRLQTAIKMVKDKMPTYKEFFINRGYKFKENGKELSNME